MKGKIILAVAGKFNDDQDRIIKRVCRVLELHDISVKCIIKVKRRISYGKVS